MTILAAIMAAPVLPAVTRACARPSLTSSAQRRIEERRFLRIGVIAGSSMPTTSSAWTISRLPGASLRAPDPSRASSASMRGRSPTRRMAAPSSAAARTAPSTAERGAWSPPMASTAIGMLGNCPPLPRSDLSRKPLLNLFAFDHLPAAVGAAVGAGAVRELHLAAVGADGDGGLLERIVRAPLVAAGFGVASLGVRHGRASSIDRAIARKAVRVLPALLGEPPLQGGV